MIIKLFLHIQEVYEKISSIYQKIIKLFIHTYEGLQLQGIALWKGGLSMGLLTLAIAEPQQQHCTFGSPPSP
jgi:hypothetical protein